jgi:hypothetical protein
MSNLKAAENLCHSNGTCAGGVLSCRDVFSLLEDEVIEALSIPAVAVCLKKKSLLHVLETAISS